MAEDEKLILNPYSGKLLPPLCSRYTEDEIKAIVERTHGLTSSICGALDCSAQQWYGYLETRQHIKDLQEKSRLEMVNLAEKKLLDLLNDENPQVSQRAAEFILRRLGANRGWADSPIVQQITTDKDGITKIQQIFGISQ